MTNSIKFLGLDLSEGISRRHLVAYFLLAFISSAYAGAMSMLQPGLLQLMDVPADQQGMITGNLSALQEVIFIVLLGVLGVVADRIGRKTVYVLGMLITSAGFYLYPQANSISELVVYRIIVAVGSAALVGMMVTVIADYSRDKTRGKANGWQGVIATFGAFIPPLLGALPKIFVDQGYSEIEAQQLTFAWAGGMGLVGAVIGFLGLAPHVKKVSVIAKESFTQMLSKGLHAARDPGTALSYGAAFISRGDLAVTGAFMGLWLVQYGVQNLAMQPSQAMYELAVPRVLATVVGALFGAIIMGIVSDKINRVTAVSIAAGMATIAYLGIFFVEDPTAPWVMALLAFMGVAEISAFVSSQALVGQQAPDNRRGAVLGFFGVAGAIGILVGTSIGGWLFSNIGPSAPFILFGVLNFIVCVWSILVRKKVSAPQQLQASI